MENVWRERGEMEVMAYGISFNNEGYTMVLLSLSYLVGGFRSIVILYTVIPHALLRVRALSCPVPLTIIDLAIAGIGVLGLTLR